MMPSSTVGDLISSFEGWDSDVIALRRALLRDLRAVPVDHPIRDQVASFQKDIDLLAFNLKTGIIEKQGAQRYLSIEWAPLRLAIQVAAKAALH